MGDFVGGRRVDIAIVGSGVSGLTAAYVLSGSHQVTLFEAEEQLGGHAHTARVKELDREYLVDTGFLVYNETTYPNFIRLLDELGVATHESVMSFSYRDDVAGVEWKGSSLATVFAQARNLVRPKFLRMLVDILSFNRTLRSLLASDDVASSRSLEDVLATRSWGRGFREWYLVPMGAAIWSASPEDFTQIPARTFAEFFSRHGLLNVRGMPQWRTITGGSREYVERIGAVVRSRGRVATSTPVRIVRRIARGVEVTTDEGTTRFDHVVLACHSDQALELLDDPTPSEREVLGQLRYQYNEVTLHRDTSLLPTRRRVRAAWNYHRDGEANDLATLTYDISTLQSLDAPEPFLVSLNSERLIDPAKVLERYHYAHPVLDGASVAAQARRSEVFSDTTSYCGAYWSYGFHEDGVRSALEVAAHLGVHW